MVLEKANDWNTLPKHVDEDQVHLDIDRSFIYYPSGRPPIVMIFDDLFLGLNPIDMFVHRSVSSRIGDQEERTV